MDLSYHKTAFQLAGSIWRRDDLSASEKMVALAVAWHGDNCFPGRHRLAKITGLSERTVSRAIKSLNGKVFLVTGSTAPGRLINYKFLAHGTLCPVLEDERVPNPTKTSSKRVPNPTLYKQNLKTREQIDGGHEPNPKSPLGWDWRPPDDLWEWTVREMTGLDLEDELENFKTYWCDKRSNERRSPRGWNSTWKKWIKKNWMEQSHATNRTNYRDARANRAMESRSRRLEIEKRLATRDADRAAGLLGPGLPDRG